MRKTIVIFGALFTLPAMAGSLLKATEFPKTFEDLSFTSRIEVLREGYMPFEVQYDDNGVCVSGCAYRGLTIKEDMEAVDEATEQMAELIANAEINQPADDIAPSQPTVPEQPTQPVPPTSPQPAQPTQPYTPPETSSSDYVIRDWCHNGLNQKLPLRYPVDMSNFKHMITSDFGFRKIKQGSKFHPALDIGVPEGTPVYATADGIVDAAGYDIYGGGNYVNIKHDNGIITQYLHLSQQLVTIGQVVRACDKIALSGNTGTSTGPHLDYRIRFQSDRNKYVDILCPHKASNRNSYQSFDINITSADDLHSLFHAQYKFKNSSAKHSKWRVEHKHCMFSLDDLLPDEAR